MTYLKAHFLISKHGFFCFFFEFPSLLQIFYLIALWSGRVIYITLIIWNLVRLILWPNV